MKKLLLFIAIAITTFNFIGCHTNDAGTKENVSFYKVPLVCGAAPEIGCGSRIKPLFVATEKEKGIKESWTNRQGTIIAIVWNVGVDSTNQQIIQKLFTENDIQAERITDTSDLKEMHASFRDAGKWLKGMEVDKLSIEEAAVIAKEVTDFAIEEEIINSNEAAKIQRDIEEYFKKELVKVRTLENLSSDSTQEAWRKDMYNVFVTHVGKEKADKVSIAYQKKMSEIKECE